MKITLQKQVFRQFHPQFRVGVVLLQGIDNHRKLPQSLHLLHETEKAIRLTHHPELLKYHNLIQPWAVAQQEFGPIAKHYDTSVERLLKAVLGKQKIAAKDTATNLVKALSLRYVVPMGVDDLDKIQGNIEFRIAAGSEEVGWFLLLKKGTLYYRDAQKILGTKLDYWKSGKTKLNRKTTDVLVHIEALPPVSMAKLTVITRETAGLLQAFCGGKARTFILDKQRNSVEFH